MAARWRLPAQSHSHAGAMQCALRHRAAFPIGIFRIAELGEENLIGVVSPPGENSAVGALYGSQMAFTRTITQSCWRHAVCPTSPRRLSDRYFSHSRAG